MTTVLTKSSLIVKKWYVQLFSFGGWGLIAPARIFMKFRLVFLRDSKQGCSFVLFVCFLCAFCVLFGGLL